MPLTLSEQFSLKLKKLDIGDSMKLQNGAASVSQMSAWYRAAKRQGMKVSIRSMPDGVRLYRIS